MPVQIRVRDNGPYRITAGAIELLDSEGNPIAYEGEMLALCRCGQSSRKPLCDGTHREVGFESSPRAAPEGRS